MVQICQSLLKESLLEDAIRAGDCLAMLVEYFHGAGRMQEAYVHLQDMEARNIALHPYVDAQILEEVFKAVGAPEGGVASKQVNKGGSGPRTPSSSGDGGRDTHHDNNNDGIDSDIERPLNVSWTLNCTITSSASSPTTSRPASPQTKRGVARGSSSAGLNR